MVASRHLLGYDFKASVHDARRQEGRECPFFQAKMSKPSQKDQNIQTSDLTNQALLGCTSKQEGCSTFLAYGVFPEFPEEKIC